MYPELFHIGSFTVYSYGLLVALGFLAGSIWVMKRAEAAGQDVDLFLQAIFWMLVTGFAGARLLYVFYFPEVYLNDPLRIILDRGGLVWYGGLISALLAAVVFTRIKKIPLVTFGDITAAPAALGLAIGRLGCFMTGCCYGKATTLPWGVRFPEGHEAHDLVVHPTQLYESLGVLVLIVLLQAVSQRTKRPGMVMGTFFVGYGIIRFALEYVRGDGIYWVPNLLTASQVLSLISMGLGLWLLKSAKPKVLSETAVNSGS